MGRPSKFTPDRCDRFVDALRTGVFPETAGHFAGWAPATMYRHLAGTSPAHEAFRDRVRAVETELEMRLAGTVTAAAFNDPRLALSLLERRFGERWGSRAGLLAQPTDEAGSETGSSRGVLVIDPAVIEAMVPKLLEASIGSSASQAARDRVRRFTVPHPNDPDE